MEKCAFYCLTHASPDKQAFMTARFERLGIQDVHFYLGTHDDDPRLSDAKNTRVKRQWAMTYSHLDMIHAFYYDCPKPYAIICEDDIMIHRQLARMLKHIVHDFHVMRLDLLLLGYMMPYKLSPRDCHIHYPLKYKHSSAFNSKTDFTYHEYPDYMSGSQMYMIHKPFAKYLLTKYYRTSIDGGPFFVDKTILKEGNRALLYPMVALEDDDQTDEYHQLCRNIHANELFV